LLREKFKNDFTREPIDTKFFYQKGGSFLPEQRNFHKRKKKMNSLLAKNWAVKPQPFLSPRAFIHSFVSHPIANRMKITTQLTATDKSKIRELRKSDPEKYSIRKLAKMFSASPEYVSKIARTNQVGFKTLETKKDIARIDLLRIKMKDEKKAKFHLWLHKQKIKEIQGEIKKKQEKDIISAKLKENQLRNQDIKERRAKGEHITRRPFGVLERE
jgi:hypothetical protein